MLLYDLSVVGHGIFQWVWVGAGSATLVSFADWIRFFTLHGCGCLRLFFSSEVGFLAHKEYRML